MSIKDWPEGDRPREKLLAHGSSVLSDAELLAIFLRVGVAGKSALDLARDLLAEFGGLRLLMRADLPSFCRAKGLGTAKFAQLQAVLELSRRVLIADLPQKDLLCEPKLVSEYLTMRLRDGDREIFLGLFLDRQNQLIRSVELATGSLSEARVYPREVVKTALSLGAAAVIVAHNHPSGNSTPSQADQILTQRLKAALATVDVTLLDHFVVGEGAPYSFAERGLL